MGVQIPSGRPKLKAPFMGAFSFGLSRIRRDLKPTVKKMPLWGIFREERLWRHSYVQDATGEVRGLGLYKVLRAETVPEESMTPFMGAFSFDLSRIRRDLKPTVKKMPLWGIFREERLWRHSYVQDATGEVRGLGLYKVLRAETVPEESMTPFMGAFSFDLSRIRRDLKPTVKKMPLWGIFREERLWRHSYVQDATGEVRGLGLYKVLRAEAVPEESMTPFMGAFSFVCQESEGI